MPPRANQTIANDEPNIQQIGTATDESLRRLSVNRSVGQHSDGCPEDSFTVNTEKEADQYTGQSTEHSGYPPVIHSVDQDQQVISLQRKKHINLHMN